MKIFGWMQNKINARFGCNNNIHSIPLNHEHYKKAIKKEIDQNKEFSDWPDGLLAIGTFGNTNKDFKKEEEENSKPNSNQELTVEEVDKIQNELNSLLEQDDCTNNNTESRVVFGGSKTINNVDNSINNINKKSFSFLLKKMFVCRAGFPPTLTIKDQVPESSMEKMLRAILHKKIYPQNPNATNSSSKKVLHNKLKPTCEKEAQEKDDKGSKWVKTDSEYIVLEI